MALLYMDSAHNHTNLQESRQMFDASGWSSNGNLIRQGPFPRNAGKLKAFGSRPGSASIRSLKQASTADIAIYALIQFTPYWAPTKNINTQTATAKPFILLSDGSKAGNEAVAARENIALVNMSYSVAYIGVNYWWSNSSTYNVRSNNNSEWADGEWHVLQVRYKADDSTGICQMYLDDELIIDVTGADTILGTSPPSWSGMTHITIGTQGACETRYGTLVVYDSATSPTGCLTTSDFPLGIAAVQRLRTNAAGTYSQFDPGNLTNNWQAHQGLTRTIYSPTVKTTTADSIDTYGFANLDGSPTPIALQVSAYCEASGNNAAYVKGVARSVSTDGVSSSVLVVGPQKRYEMEIPYDPNTTTDWTASGINAAEFGVKYTTS
jgi:hypothetical protein